MTIGGRTRWPGRTKAQLVVACGVGCIHGLRGQGRARRASRMISEHHNLRGLTEAAIKTVSYATVKRRPSAFA